MQIEDALRGISSADNGTRTAWEAQIDSEMERNKDGLLMSLCASMAGGSSSNNALAAILFRRLSMRDGVWAALESSNREAIKDRLLKLVFYDSDLAWEARAKICDAIAEIRRIESCSWPALTSSISMISNTKDEQTSLAALRIIYECPESLVGEFDSRAAVNLLMQCPSHSKNLQLAIVRSFCAVLPLYASGGRPDDCRPFMPILENLAPLMDSLVLVGDDEDHLINFVGNLIGAVEECPKIFRSVLEPLLASCFRALAWPLDGVQSITDAYNFSRQNEDKCLVISSPDSAEEILELMVTLVEVSPRRIIKSPRIIECCLGTAMLTVALALGEDWDNKSNDEDEEEEELSLSAECAVDRISIAVSGSTNFAQSLISNINTMLISGSWQLQWAALRSLANAAEGAVDILRPSLHQIFGKIILPHLTTSNSHSPRVNYAACHALGQLATDFESSLRSDESLISTCLSALVTLLVSSECTRVQGHAAAALVNFAEGAEQRLLVPLLDPLMQRLLLLLNMSKENSINVKLVEQLISTVGAFAGATRKAFAPYAQPTLLCITSFLDVPDMSPSIQANCIETATIVLEATFSLLDPQTFINPIIQGMIKLQQSESTDDVVKEALPDAWLRVARIVGCDAFVPLAHIPLAGFLANASLQPDLAVVAAGREHELDNYDPNDWQFASSGNRHVGIRTSTLDAKAAALDNLTGILECVGKSPVFRENSLSSILNVVQPLINFQLDDRIAVAAVQAFAAGIRCGGNEFCSRSGISIQPVYEIIAAADEKSADLVVACLDAIAGVLPVDPNLAGGLDNAIAAVLNVHEKCVIKGLEALGGPNQSSTEEEDDEDDLRDEDLLNDTESLLYGVIRLAGGLLTVSGINALSKMTPLMSFCSVYGPAFIPESSKISFTRHATLCLLDDVIRHAPESATFAQANELICRSLLSCIGDQKTLKNTTSTFLQNRDQDELQAAIYGIGIAAEKSAAHYENLCLHSALPVLLNGILANASAFSRVVVENSLSTIARICRAYCALGHANINEDFINNQIIPLWLPLLPPREDSEEAPVIVEWLLERCEMYDSLYGSKFIFDDSTFDKTIPSGHALYVFQDALKMSEMGGDVDYPKALLERISARISLLIGGNGSSLPLAHLNYARSKAI